jgi:uncharacterized protein YciI
VGNFVADFHNHTILALLEIRRVKNLRIFDTKILLVLKVKINKGRNAMLFAVICIDNDNAANVRVEKKSEHIEFLQKHISSFKIVGPFLDENDKSIGGIAIIDARDRDSLNLLIAQDPFVASGVFKEVRIYPWRDTFGKLG